MNPTDTTVTTADAAVTTTTAETDRTAATVVENDSGDKAIIQRGPLAEVFGRALNHYYAKRSGISGNYSMESISTDVVLLRQNDSGAEVKTVKGPTNSHVIYGQKAEDANKEDVSAFVELKDELREGDTLHLVLVGYDEAQASSHVKALVSLAKGYDVTIYAGLSECLAAITGEEAEADPDSEEVQYSQEAVLNSFIRKLTGRNLSGQEEKVLGIIEQLKDMPTSADPVSYAVNAGKVVGFGYRQQRMITNLIPELQKDIQNFALINAALEEGTAIYKQLPQLKDEKAIQAVFEKSKFGEKMHGLGKIAFLGSVMFTATDEKAKVKQDALVGTWTNPRQFGFASRWPRLTLTIATIPALGPFSVLAGLIGGSISAHVIDKVMKPLTKAMTVPENQFQKTGVDFYKVIGSVLMKLKDFEENEEKLRNLIESDKVDTLKLRGELAAFNKSYQSLCEVALSQITVVNNFYDMVLTKAYDKGRRVL